jgi:hypothetical protein
LHGLCNFERVLAGLNEITVVNVSESNQEEELFRYNQRCILLLRVHF